MVRSKLYWLGFSKQPYVWGNRIGLKIPSNKILIETCDRHISLEQKYENKYVSKIISVELKTLMGLGFLGKSTNKVGNGAPFVKSKGIFSSYHLTQLAHSYKQRWTDTDKDLSLNLGNGQRQKLETKV